MDKNLENKVSGAVRWSTATEIITRVIAPVVNIVLARLLAPSAFGVVATLTMITSFAEIFTDAGFQKYIVQHEFEDESDLNLCTNVAFWTNILLSFLIWGIIIAFSEPIAALVGSEGHEQAIAVMSAEIPLLAFSSIQAARYRRSFDFKSLFVSRLVVALVPLFVTIPCALYFRNYWALVYGTLTKDVINALILTVKSKWKPSFNYSFSKLKEMVSFSVWSVLENISIWLSSNSGTFIVGSILGAYYLGLYKTTITTVSGYFNIVQGAALPVLFAALSRCQNNEREFEAVFHKFQRILAILVFPLGFGVFAYRELAVVVLLGEQWMETSLFLGLESLIRSFLVVYSYFNSEALRSRGKPHLSALAQCVYIILSIPIVAWSANRGYVMLSVMGSCVALSLILVTSFVVNKVLKIHFFDAVKNTWPSILASIFMTAIGHVFVKLSDNYLWQFVSIPICAVLYFMILFTIPKGRKLLLEVPFVNRMINRLNNC